MLAVHPLSEADRVCVRDEDDFAFDPARRVCSDEPAKEMVEHEHARRLVRMDTCLEIGFRPRARLAEAMDGETACGAGADGGKFDALNAVRHGVEPRGRPARCQGCFDVPQLPLVKGTLHNGAGADPRRHIKTKVSLVSRDRQTTTESSAGHRESAATAAPAEIVALQQRAMAAYRTGQPEAALSACREILARQPERADVASFAGVVAAEAGQLEDAIGFYRQAIAAKPDFVEAHFNLARACQRLGRQEDAIASYRAALALRPGLIPALHNLGGALQALGRFDEAIACYEKALAKHSSAETEQDLGATLRSAGRWDEAIAAFRRAVALELDWPVPYSSLAGALLEKGDMAGVLEICGRWLDAIPASIEGQALKALALNELGEVKGASGILDFDRFVQVIDFESAPGFANLAEFNAALVRHVEAHPTLGVPPEGDPTYHHPALQITEELLVEPRGPMAALEIMIRQAIHRYLETVPSTPIHPFLVNFPKRWTLRAWATRLAGQGNLVPHIHLEGYFGGVYYPLLPKVVGESGHGEAGWFELGRPPEELGCKAPPVIRRIQPREGRMLLFPGYMYHNTIPFTSTERRISIAFDVVAEQIAP